MNIMRCIALSLFVFVLILSFGCSDSNPAGVNERVENGNENENGDEDHENGLEIYIPEEFSEMDFEDNSSEWSFERSRESEHFIVFWGEGYGDEDPGSENTDASHRVDIDDLLEKAELYYDQHVHDLKFAEIGVGNSNLDHYKMMIFLYHDTSIYAFGSGYDDVIGALWIGPNAAQPVGSVVAHEIGHSFQYQVYSDLGGGAGFRYGFGGNGGNAFWEQSAQWQSFYAYPDQIFGNDFNVYVENYNKHIHHEHYRYASYFILYHWTDRHGLDMVARIWREAQEPEDPIEAYMRLTGINTQELNDEIFEAATKNVTWDLDALRSLGENSIGRHQFDYNTLDDGSHMPIYGYAPQTTGYNVIPLNVPDGGGVVSVDFTGLPNAEGFNPVDATIAGWRYGFVALQTNGQRVYGEMNSEHEGAASFTVPNNVERLWFVVTGAPTEYSPHPWDEDLSNDPQWPYKMKFSNTNILGMIDLPDDGEPEDGTLSYDISFPVSETSYDGVVVEADISAVASSFLMQPNEISQLIGDSIQFVAVESDGTLNPDYTANGYGHWFDSNGDVIGWGEHASVYSEFRENSFSFEIGQYPGQNSAGDTVQIRQALVYEYEPGEKVQFVFEFNITLD